MNKWLELLLGLALFIVPLLIAITNAFWGLGTATLEFVKGGVVVGLILIGLMLIILGISDITSG